MSAREGGKPTAGAGARGSSRRRPTQAQLLERQLEILNDREVRTMSWAAIARKHAMGEKEARETYSRYVREIAPLIVEQAPVETVQVYVRLLEGTRQRLSEVVENADNDSARIGGLREITKTIVKEIDMLERAGLMPTNLADAHVRAEHERLLGRMEEVLRRHGLSAEVYEELAAVFAGEGGG
jgi:hypothetical protein